MNPQFDLEDTLKTGFGRCIRGRSPILAALIAALYFVLGIIVYGLIIGLVVVVVKAMGGADPRVDSPAYAMINSFGISLVSTIVFAPVAINAHRNYLLGEPWELNWISIYESEFGLRYLGEIVWLLVVVSGPWIILEAIEPWANPDGIDEAPTWYGLAILGAIAWALIGARWFLVLPGSAIGHRFDIFESAKSLNQSHLALIFSIGVINLPFYLIFGALGWFSLPSVANAETFLMLALVGFVSSLQIIANAYMLSYIYKMQTKMPERRADMSRISR